MLSPLTLRWPQAWFAEMPRPLLQLPQKRAAAALGAASSGVARAAGTIDQYYLSRHCAVGSCLPLLYM